MDYLNTKSLEHWTDEDLLEYQINLQKMIARCAIFEAQVQDEWDRRTEERQH